MPRASGSHGIDLPAGTTTASHAAECEGDPMRAFPILIAAAVAVTGLAATSLVVPGLDGPALAQKAKPSKKRQRSPSTYGPRTTGFEHQQCSVQNPCSTRNQW